MSGVDSDNGIWSLRVARKRHKYDFLLAGAIGTLYFPKRMADLGCGPGYYCKIFKSFGWPVVDGYEGTAKIEEISVYNRIVKVNLAGDVGNIVPYDLVVCLEVGEHIPEKKESNFIANLVKFSCKDLVLSWAVPGQGGTGHFNEKDNKYIIGKLADNNYIFNKEKAEFLRLHSSLRWFKNTLMVFERA